MKKNKKIIYWGIALIALVSLIFISMKPKPVVVDIRDVTSGPLMVTVDEDGETMIRDPYTISAPLPGQLLRLKLEPGDAIAKNSVLAVIDPSEPILLDARTEAEAKARLSAAEANVERLTSQLEVQKAEVEKWQRYAERDEGRLAKELISAPALEDTRHALRVARGNLNTGKSALKVAQYEVNQAKALLDHTLLQDPKSIKESDCHFLIKSPTKGVILRRFKESSTVVAAGTPIMEIGDTTDLEIRIDVLSQDAVKIKPGQRVIIEHWGGDKELKAHIRRVEPSAFTKVSALGVDEQRVFVYADFSGEESEVANLGDAYRIEARIVVWEKEETLRIPSGAIFRQGETWATYVVEGRKAELRQIEIGNDNGIEAEVLSGVKAGERVILHPGDRVEPGTVVVGEG